MGLGALFYALVFAGGDDDEAAAGGGDYCAVVKEHRKTLKAMTADESNDDLEAIAQTLHDLRSAAPAEVSKEWAQLDDPFVGLEKALEDAGMTWNEAAEIQDESDFPDEVRDAVEEFADAYEGIDIDANLQKISDHAKQECGVKLTRGSSEE